MASSSTHATPCAACKFLKQQCLPECVHAPLFPSDQPEKLATIQRVFGFSNAMKLLNEIHPCQRLEAANVLSYQAEMRLRDPVYGCVGVISFLQHHNNQLQMELNHAKYDLAKHTSLGMMCAHDHGSNMTSYNGGVVANDLQMHDFFNNNNQVLARDVEVGNCDANGSLQVDGSPSHLKEIGVGHAEDNEEAVNLSL